MTANLLTVAAAARLAGVPRSTIQSAIARGDLPATRINAALPPLVTLRDVQTWKKNGCHTPGRKPPNAKLPSVG
jgi:excisionase family DNA binding protein